MALSNIRAGVLRKCSAGNYDLPTFFGLEDISVNRQHLAIRNIDRSAISIKHHALFTAAAKCASRHIHNSASLSFNEFKFASAGFKISFAYIYR